MLEFLLLFLLFQNLFALLLEHCVLLFCQERISQHIVVNKIVVLENSLQQKPCRMPKNPRTIHLTSFPIALILIPIRPGNLTSSMIVSFMKGTIIKSPISILDNSLTTFLIPIPISLQSQKSYLILALGYTRL